MNKSGNNSSNLSFVIDSDINLNDHFVSEDNLNVDTTIKTSDITKIYKFAYFQIMGYLQDYKETNSFQIHLKHMVSQNEENNHRLYLFNMVSTNV